MSLTETVVIMIIIIMLGINSKILSHIKCSYFHNNNHMKIKSTHIIKADNLKKKIK